MPDNPFVAAAVLLGWTVLIGAPIVAVVGWWLNRKPRAHPSVRFAGPAIELPPARALDEPTQILRVIGRARVVDNWATLGEFAGRDAREPALIGSDVEALFTLRRAAVTP